MTEPKKPVRRPNRTTIELPPPLRQGLKALKERTGRTEADLLRQAVQEFLERQGV